MKQMMIFTYDHHRIIMIDRVSCGTRTFTSIIFCKSCEERCTKSCPNCLQLGHSIFMTMPELNNVVKEKLLEYD